MSKIPGTKEAEVGGAKVGGQNEKFSETLSHNIRKKGGGIQLSCRVFAEHVQGAVFNCQYPPPIHTKGVSSAIYSEPICSQHL